MHSPYERGESPFKYKCARHVLKKYKNAIFKLNIFLLFVKKIGPNKRKLKYMYTYFEHIPRTLHLKLLSKYYIAVHYKLWKYFSVSFEIIRVVFPDFTKSFFKDNQSLEIHIQIKFLGWFGCVCWPNKLNEAQSWPQSCKTWTFFRKFLEILTCNKNTTMIDTQWT